MKEKQYKIILTEQELYYIINTLLQDRALNISECDNEYEWIGQLVEKLEDNKEELDNE